MHNRHMTIQERLKRDRERRLLTWAEYSKQAGLSERAIYAIASGGTPSTLSRVKIERFMGKRVSRKAS